MSLFGAQPSDPTMKTFHLICKVFPIVKGHSDVRAKGNLGVVQDAMVCLVPDEGTARDSFLTAWAPQADSEFPEVMCEGPNVGFFKSCVRRPSSECNQYHLFVMSKDAEEQLLDLHNENALAGRYAKMPIRVLPETTEAAAFMQEIENE